MATETSLGSLRQRHSSHVPGVLPSVFTAQRDHVGGVRDTRAQVCRPGACQDGAAQQMATVCAGRRRARNQALLACGGAPLRIGGHANVAKVASSAKPRHSGARGGAAGTLVPAHRLRYSPSPLPLSLFLYFPPLVLNLFRAAHSLLLFATRVRAPGRSQPRLRPWYVEKCARLVANMCGAWTWRAREGPAAGLAGCGGCARPRAAVSQNAQSPLLRQTAACSLEIGFARALGAPKPQDMWAHPSHLPSPQVSMVLDCSRTAQSPYVCCCRQRRSQSTRGLRGAFMAPLVIAEACDLVVVVGVALESGAIANL